MGTQTDVLPVFPLGTVLLPGAPQALHIFEQRYRQLLLDVTSGPHPRRGFGIVALQRGLEAGTNANSLLSDVGTMAEILEVRGYPDGTSDLYLVGSRRFRVLAVGEAPAGYLTARVEWLDERDGELRAGDVAAARSQAGVYRAMLARLVGQDAAGQDSVGSDDDDEPLPTDPVRLSYALAQRLFLPIADRQRLLAADSAADRIRMAMALLRRETVLLQNTRSVPVPSQSLIRRVSAN